LPAHRKQHGEKETRRGASPAQGRRRGRAHGVDGGIDGEAWTALGHARLSGDLRGTMVER
jgi:hypothetical protein